jgi:hypothetical protein
MKIYVKLCATACLQAVKFVVLPTALLASKQWHTSFCQKLLGH